MSGPTARLSLRCGGEIVSHMRKVRRIDRVVAPWRRREVKVKLLCGGKAFHFEQAATEEENITENGDIRQVRETAIEIEPSDFEISDDLSRCFFGSPGRMEPCARCKARRRSMLSCRVKRAHSNFDYDCSSTFKGIGGGRWSSSRSSSRRNGVDCSERKWRK